MYNHFYMALTLRLTVWHGFLNKQRLLSYPELTYLLCITEVECLLRGTQMSPYIKQIHCLHRANSIQPKFVWNSDGLILAL